MCLFNFLKCNLLLVMFINELEVKGIKSVKIELINSYLESYFSYIFIYKMY